MYFSSRQHTLTSAQTPHPSPGWKQLKLYSGQGAALLGILVFGLSATGCGNSNPPAQKATPQVRTWGIDQDIDPLREAMQEFEQNNKIATTYSNKSIDGYELASLKSMTAKTGPDVWTIPNDWLGDNEDQIQPLPDTFYTDENKKVTKPFDAVHLAYPAGIADQLILSNGKVAGLPTNVDVLRLYYNPDVFGAALDDYRQSLGDEPDEALLQHATDTLKSPPTTWNDLLEQEKYITKINNGSIVRSTIAMGSADNVANAQEILEMLMLQNGTDIVSSDRHNVLFHLPKDTPGGNKVYPGERALDFYTSFATPGKENYTWNASMPPAIDAFTKGQVAMVIAFSDFGRQLKINHPSLNFEVAAIPQISASQQGTNLIRFNVETVTKVAENSANAFNFLHVFTDTGTVRGMATNQNVHSPFLTTLKEDEGDIIAKQILTGQSVYKKDRLHFDAAFREMIVDVNQNGISPHDAMLSGAETLNKIFLPPTPNPRDNIRPGTN